MAKFSYIQNALNGGEVTPLARGRTDAPQYRNSLEDCKNMIPFVAGGAARRQGTTYFNKVGSSGGQLNLGNAVERFIPWELSTGERFMVCLGGSAAIKIVNITTNALVTITDGVANAPSGTRTVGTLTTTEAQTAQYTQIGDALIIAADTAPHIYLVYQTIISEVYRYGPLDQPSRVLNVGGTTQTITDARNETRVPFFPVNTSTITMTWGSATLTAGTTSTITASADFFNAGHIGSIFKFHAGSVLVTAYTGATVVSGRILDALDTNTATASWEESAWSDFRGWPRTVGYFNSRLVFGGSTKSPDTLWFSQDGDIYQMSMAIGGTPGDADAFAVVPNGAEKVSKINWLITGQDFAFGTEREEFTVVIPDVSAGFSASNIKISKQTSRGSKYVQAVRIESAAYFVASDGQRIIEFVFDERENNYRNRDVNIFADHLFAKFQEQHSSPWAEATISSMCKISDKDQKLWVMDNAGGLFSCSVDRMFNINAWAMHYLGGNGSGADLDPAPFVRAIAPLNNKNLPTAVSQGHDVLWMSTGRTINSSFSNFLEYMEETASTGDDFLDFKKSTSQASSTTVTGLTYLANETVKVVANGLYVGEKTVNGSGEITLTTAATLVIVGFGFKSRIKTLPVEAGSQIGSALGAIQRIDQARIGFYRSANASIGSVERDDASDLEEISFRAASLASSTPTPLFTGYKIINLPHDYENGAQVVVETDGPLAMTITHVVLRGQSYD